MAPRRAWLLATLALAACSKKALFAPAEVAHVCALVEGCPVPWLGVVGVDLTSCFWRVDQMGARVALEPETRALLACLSRASDCAAARACAGASNVRCARDGTGRCDGGELVSCHYGFEYRKACWAEGGTCAATNPGNSASCVYGACTENVCDGYHFGECESNQIREKEDCRPGICTRDGCWLPGGGAACSTGRCLGNVTVACDEGHERIQADCARIGGTCFVNASFAARCGFPGKPCAIDSRARCAGNVAHLCGRGEETAVDCAALGLRCVDEPAGSRCASR